LKNRIDAALGWFFDAPHPVENGNTQETLMRIMSVIFLLFVVAGCAMMNTPSG